MSHVAALILAAGFSTRMKAFKPLLPLGRERTILSRVVRLWQRCGVTSICVVTGHKAESVEEEAARLGCRTVRNLHPEEGMFSSVQCGIRYFLQADRQAAVSWCAVHPVDIPLIQEATIAALCKRARSSQADCLLPCHKGRAGHPPLLHARILADIAAFQGDGGLRAAMQQLAQEYCEVTDPWLNTDLDRPEDYAQAQALLAAQSE